MNKADRIKNFFKEPLLHFLLIGAVLFLVYGWRGNSASVSGMSTALPIAQIVVSQDHIDQMNRQFEKVWQRPPSAEEQKRLIDDFVRNEIYYREAIAIGLDRNDDVLKRRLRQKMEFIYEDINSLVEPTDDELKVFMQKHRDKYLEDPQISFRQVYISTYKRGKSAESDARQLLTQLSAGVDPDSVGDTTLLESEVILTPVWDITKQFGDEFCRNLLAIKPGIWAGPIRSSYGLHVVYVKEHTGMRLPDLNEVREKVKRDWLVEKQKEMKDAAYEKIRKRYSVTVEKPKTGVIPVARAATTEVLVR